MWTRTPREGIIMMLELHIEVSVRCGVLIDPVTNAVSGASRVRTLGTNAGQSCARIS